MTVHEHDRDLIMDLVEGTLDEAASERARNEISGCAECRTDLADLEVALSALGDLGPVPMSEFESARLTRDLDVALAHERPAATPAVPSENPKRRISWVPLGSIAAVLLAVVLIAPGLELLGGSDDSSDLATAAFEQDDDSDAADAADEAADDGAAMSALEAPQAETSDVEEEVAADAEEEGGAAIESTESDREPTTTASAGEMAPPPAPDVTDDLGDLAVDAAAAGVQSEPVREKAASDRVLGYAAPTTENQCSAEAAAYVDTPATTYTLGDVTLPSTGERVTVTVSIVDDLTVLLAHDPATCAVVGATTVG